MRLYGERQPEAIEWVLRTWRKRSPFWPSQADLDSLFREYAKLQTDHEQAKQMEENRNTRKRLAEEGLPHGPEQFNGLMAKLKSLVKEMPEVTPNRRMELKDRIEKIRADKQKSA